MNKKLLTRFVCALLTVLTVVAVVPAFTISVSAATDDDGKIDYTYIEYESPEDRVEKTMTQFYANEEYTLYCDTKLGIVAYRKNATGEYLFSNPWDMSLELSADEVTRSDLMSQIILYYSGNGASDKALDSYTDAALKGQVTVKPIKNGVRVEYAIGERSARILVPQVIERSSLEQKIFEPIKQALGESSREYIKFKSFFNDMFYTEEKATKKESIAMQYPVTKEKNIDIYVCDVNTTTKQLRELEAMILTYCPAYSFEVMDNDYDFVEYEETATSPAVFKMALEYTLDGNGLVASLSGNGLRYDENVYRINQLQILPYMGASDKANEGYSFIPDGSGSLYELDTVTTTSLRVYGDDYSLFNKLYGYHTETIRMPIFGQVEEDFDPEMISPPIYDATGNLIKDAVYSETEGKRESRGFLAIIEKGDSLANISLNHVAYHQYSSIFANFTTRQSDKSASDWSVYAKRRYVDDYQIRYIMLSDDARAEKAGLTSYYECSWMGMAFAYRDYLSTKNEGYQRLTAEDVQTSIPLYIETFGCVDTVEKVLSMPVTVSVALTSFEDIATMYDYLAGNGVTNVNFKLKGYANGGLYSEVPRKLKWEGAVGGSSGFKDLLEKAAAEGFGLYPDFDFVYTSHSGVDVNMKKNAARTIDNRYTARRSYSATHQALVSYYQMVLSPVTYSNFYEKLEKKYSRYENSGIALSTFGNSLNSDYDEEKTALREEAKDYVIQALTYFDNYDIMVEGGNAYTWNNAEHILNIPIDSSRYTAEKSAIPFMGVVLHGYKEFTGSAFNMEGNLSYAMLKAIENGASAYFILSYANTALLKEDELLSQNYSVRYDIWQQRLVEIYLELNNVLADVQTKIIINHEHLDASRVPDEDELLKDIEEAAKEAQQAIADKIEADRLARLEMLSNAESYIADAAVSLPTSTLQIGNAFEVMKGMRKIATESALTAAIVACNDALKALESAKADLAAAQAADPVDATAVANAEGAVKSAEKAYEKAVKALDSQFKALASQVLYINDYVETAIATIAKAQENYLLLVAENVNEQIMATALNNLKSSVASYAGFVCAYLNIAPVTLDDATVDAFIAGDIDVEALSAEITAGYTAVEVDGADLVDYLINAADTYADIAAEGLFQAYVDLLMAPAAQGGCGYTADQIQALLDSLNTSSTPTPPATPDEPGDDTPGVDGEDAVVPDPPKSKYAVDNNVVAVTYGDSIDTPFKTVLLNFNDYEVQTTYNGVTYTIESYGYVVIRY